jgi:hypothetical protein
MGTSLNVYPFAELTGDVGPLVPRVLVNREPVGCFMETPTDKDDKPIKNYRDLMLLGDCDDKIKELREALGWITTDSPKKPAQKKTNQPEKNKTEV